MDKNIESIKTRMSVLNDKKLIEIVNINNDEYTSKAIEIAKEELKSRNIMNFQVLEKNIICKNTLSEYILFRDLILQVRYEDIEKKLSKLYQIDKSLYKNYEKVFNQFIHISNFEVKNICILVEETDNLFNPQFKDWQVIGQNIKTKELFEIEFSEWKDWLGFSVNTEQVNLVGKESFVAHCLYKMTNHMFNQQDGLILQSEMDLEEQRIETHPWIRLWARQIDYTVFGIFLSYIWVLLPNNISKAIFSLERIIYTIPFLWIFIEMILISKIGTTLGKYILNIRVKKRDGDKLSFIEAFYRSYLVWIIGLGFGIRIVEIFTQLYAYLKLKERGISSWDKKINSKIIYGEIGGLRILLAILILIGIPILRFKGLI